MARSSSAPATKRATKPAGRRASALAPEERHHSRLVDSMVATGRYTRVVAERILDRMPHALDGIPARVTDEVEVTTGFGTKWLYAIHKVEGGYTVSFRPLDVEKRRKSGMGHTGGFISGTSLSGIPKVYRVQKDAYAAIVDHAKRGQYLLYKNNPSDIVPGLRIGKYTVEQVRENDVIVRCAGKRGDGDDMYRVEATTLADLKRVLAPRENPRDGSEAWEFKGFRRGYEEIPMAVLRMKDTMRLKGREHAKHTTDANRADNVNSRKLAYAKAKEVNDEVNDLIDSALDRAKVEDDSDEARRYRGILFGEFRATAGNMSNPSGKGQKSGLARGQSLMAQAAAAYRAGKYPTMQAALKGTAKKSRR